MSKKVAPFMSSLIFEKIASLTRSDVGLTFWTFGTDIFSPLRDPPEIRKDICCETLSYVICYNCSRG